MTNELFRAEHLSFQYEDTDQSNPAYVVSDLSFSIEEGEYIAVLGHNGSGKSTLAKLLNLILEPTSGKLYIDGKDVTLDSFTEDDLFDVRSKIGMVFQNPDNQLVASIVLEDVAFGPENLGLPREEIKERIYEALDIVGMREYENHASAKLSGGQKQRVAIAGVLAMKPKCIIFDESTAMLDPLGRKEVLKTIKKLHEENNMTIIHITHYMEEAVLANRVMIIHDGKLAMDGTPKEVFSEVEKIRSFGLDVPQGTELIYRLKQKGYSLDSGLLTNQECADALLKMMKERT